MNTYTKIATSILFLLVFTGARTIAQEPKCNLTLAQAPELRGFKLGMSPEDVIAKMPGLNIRPANRRKYRVVAINFTPNDLSMRNGVINLDRTSYVSATRFPIYEGLTSAGIHFLDEKAFLIELFYDDSTKWNDVDEFADKVASSLHLPKAWIGDDDKSERFIKCNGFLIETELKSSTSPVLRIGDPSMLLEIQGRKEDRNEKQRNTFKP